MKTRYRILFFLIGIGGIVLLAVKAVPDKSDWSELFTPRLPLLLLGLLLLWAVIYAIHTAVYLLIMGKEAASAVGFPRMYRICISGFAINNVTPAGIVISRSPAPQNAISPTAVTLSGRTILSSPSQPKKA